MRVLHIEDDATTAHAVELMLRSEGVSVEITDLGEEGIDLAHRYEFDLVLLDLGLPDISGLEVLRKLRASKLATPVLVMTGSSQPDMEARCINAGADDFLRKPVHRDVLVARVRSLVRRSRGHAHPRVEVGNTVLETDRKTVTVAGRPLHLTGKEYQILELLVLRAGVNITKEMFLNHLYGGMDEPELKIIDVFICKLREKLRAANWNCQIETAWGRGYSLRAPETEAVAA